MTRAALALAIAVVLALPGAAGAATIKAPKSGSTYSGPPPYDVTLRISGRSVEIAAFSFPCGDGSVFGRTSVNDFRLKRTSRGYRFNADAHALVTYSDEQGDENAKVHISGRFALNAKTVRGHLQVVSKRCGDSGDAKWRAARTKR